MPFFLFFTLNRFKLSKFFMKFTLSTENETVDECYSNTFSISALIVEQLLVLDMFVFLLGQCARKYTTYILVYYSCIRKICEIK